VVTAEGGTGGTGILLREGHSGPTRLENVTVEGFTTGIYVANTRAGTTLDTVSLSSQTGPGIKAGSGRFYVKGLTI